MKDLLKKTGLYLRRYRAKAISESDIKTFEIFFGKTEIYVGTKLLEPTCTAENYGRLSLQLVTQDNLQQFLITFTENRLGFWGAAKINGEEYTIEGETEAKFETLLDNKKGATFIMGTSWIGEAIFPYYYLDDKDITDYTAATVDYVTWVTNVQKNTSPLEIKPISFNINVNYCGETFNGKMTIDQKTYVWTGERIEEDL